jgi:hypothetical protein
MFIMAALDRIQIKQIVLSSFQRIFPFSNDNCRIDQPAIPMRFDEAIDCLPNQQRARIGSGMRQPALL